MLPLKDHKARHSLAVAAYMMHRAEDYGVDPAEAYVVGLLHDVGYVNGRNNHGQEGATILLGMGLAYRYRYAIQYHGVSPFHITNENVDEDPEELRKAPYVTYDEVAAWTKRQRIYPLLLEADLRIDTVGRLVGFKSRLADLHRRYQREDVDRNAKSSVDYVFEWCERNGVKKPPTVLELASWFVSLK